MSARRPAVIEEFDDDVDIPLPNHILPNTGTRGPLLEEIRTSGVGDDVEDEEDDGDEDVRGTGGYSFGQPGPASPVRSRAGVGGGSGGNMTVTDVTPYKTWTCVYPIYIDAKRPYGRGQRRVERAKSVWWPLSKDIAEAAHRLGLGTLHEVNKSHPRDWENPGRVRVQWKKDGRLVNQAIKSSECIPLLFVGRRLCAPPAPTLPSCPICVLTRVYMTEKQLLEMICIQIHVLKPENVPKPPFNLNPTPKLVSPPVAAPKSSSSPTTTPSSSAGAIASSSTNTPSSKGKQPASSGSLPQSQSQQPSSKGGKKAKSSSSSPREVKFSKRRLPVPPTPEDPDQPTVSLSGRLSIYSPAIASGVLIDAVKAGMGGGLDGGPGGPLGALGGGAPGGAGAGGAGMGKGKRKIVRVRG
ncbi:hypothetical protein AX16_010339 [Volvariella volvacea WC 439]|nr:hypothetical protein AX16_010339 [Volvariella volvacea WC 439]